MTELCPCSFSFSEHSAGATAEAVPAPLPAQDLALPEGTSYKAVINTDQNILFRTWTQEEFLILHLWLWKVVLERSPIQK